MSGEGQRKFIYEAFKKYFASVSGAAYHPSSSEGWALSDMQDKMGQATENAPRFIEAFYDACQELEQFGVATPDVAHINRVLSDTGAGYQIDSPNLIATRTHIPIAVPDQAPSLDDQARALITNALYQSERALSDGNGRQAIQEVLRLLESFSTAIRGAGDGSIQGTYFNKIISELQQRARSHQRMILDWMMKLHGYLSSPTGGGIRHGIDFQNGLDVEINEARLFCNLTRSYLIFLIEEHDRLQRQRH